MKFAQALLWINSWLFLVFGLGFSLMPSPLAAMFTGAVPATHSAAIDMRVSEDIWFKKSRDIPG